MGTEGDDEAHTAATKIQAIHRGKSDRAFVDDRRAQMRDDGQGGGEFGGEGAGDEHR